MNKLVKVCRYERFYEEGKPEKPVLVSKSIPVDRELATEIVNDETEAYLESGYRLKRGPEGKMSIYKETARTTHEYHTWYTLEEYDNND